MEICKQQIKLKLFQKIYESPMIKRKICTFFIVLQLMFHSTGVIVKANLNKVIDKF